jgi:phosphatidylethanolamine/phosphatidyl-N-methylethanolamine N-methyltransferase
MIPILGCPRSSEPEASNSSVNLQLLRNTPLDWAGDHLAADATVFFGLWLQKPLRIAATNPSSARLADAFARCVELARPGPVLELGSGTGSLTRGLMRAGCPPDRILAVEREPRFAAMLRRDLPGVTVIEGDATEIRGYLAGRVERLCAVVSSLPIKWFPLLAQRAVVDPCLDLLGPGGRFLQLTNAFCSPLPIDRLGIAGCEIGRVWLNMLPAQIWSYSRCIEAGCGAGCADTSRW